MRHLTTSLSRMVFTLAQLARNPARRPLFLVVSVAGKSVYMLHIVSVVETVL